MSRFFEILVLLLVTFLGHTVASNHGYDGLAGAMAIAFLLTMLMGMGYFIMKAFFALTRRPKR